MEKIDTRSTFYGFYESINCALKLFYIFHLFFSLSISFLLQQQLGESCLHNSKNGNLFLPDITNKAPFYFEE